MELNTLLDFFKYLLTVGGAGVALFFILEKLPYVADWFGALESQMKRLVVLLLALGIPLAASFGGVALGYWELTEDLVYTALKVGIEVYTTSQVAHMVLSLGKKKNSA